MAIKMLVDTAVEVGVNVAALISSADFLTIDETIAYNESGMQLIWNFQTPAGVRTCTVVTPTTGGDYDWTHIDGGMYKIEIPASGGASINNDTEGVGWFSGVCAAILPWISPQYEFVPANVVNSLVTGTDFLQTDATQVEGADATDTIQSSAAAALTAYDPPTNAEMEARTLVAANYFDPAVDAVANVTLVATTTTNTDMRGTDGASTHSAADVWAVGSRTLTSFGTLVADTVAGLLGYFQLLARKDAAIATDRAAELSAINTDEGSGAGAYANTTDSLEANRDNIGTAGAGLTVAAVTGNVGGNVVGSVASVTAGVTLADDAITSAKYDETTAFPVKSDDSGVTQIARVGADGDTLETLSDQLDAIPTSNPSAADIADQVWNETLADHLTAGSTGNALNAAGAAGDPWSTAIPGAYGAGTAGKIVGDNLDAAISSRSSHSANDVTGGTTVASAESNIRGADSDTLKTLSDALDSVYTGTPPTVVQIRSEMDSNSTQLAAIVEDTGTTIPAQITGLNNLSQAQVKAEVVDVMATDTHAKPGQETPTDTPTYEEILAYLYKVLTNKKTVSNATSLFSLFNDDAVTVDQKRTLSDDGTTYTEGELVTGP